MDSIDGHFRHGQNAVNHRRAGYTQTTDESRQIVYALAACSRCRQRKVRCDPSLPRCTPCERSAAICEYYDVSKEKFIPRSYVVHLQEKVKALEAQLEQLEREAEESAQPDPETMLRAAAAVKFGETEESKYLGPSSGIAITRFVMQLAKECTSANSIKDIISEAKARQVKDRFEREQAKPTSKVYPYISSCAALQLPSRGLTEVLIRLYIAKVQYMYPLLHEPTFAKDVEAVYTGSNDPYQNFVLRMVIAISLQKMDMQYAGLADSYYLAALPFLEPVVKLRSIKTLQCYTLIGEYSNLTPTRTAVYFVIGLAVRLCQTLGFTEERSIIRDIDGQRANPLEIDMRRRLFWVIMLMEFGLAHGLGRPAIYATRPEHFDVAWFEAIDDKYITEDGILEGPCSMKKLIAIHMCKMRMLGLEIITTLYLNKRIEPQDNNHPWFQQMEAKLYKWQHESPNNDEGSGYSNIWFRGRMNTMIITMYRPSPQVPRPSAQGALKCYEACEYNICMQRNQIDTGSVDLTWPFVIVLFQNINAMLWCVSYPEVRELYPREDVEGHLNVCLECVQRASERWPGVESALELYHILIGACMNVYDKDRVIPTFTSSPDSSAALSYPEPWCHSRTQSEVTVPTAAAAPHSEKLPLFGHDLSSQANAAQISPPASTSYYSPSVGPSRSSVDSVLDAYAYQLTMPFDPQSQYNALPVFADMVNWNPAYPASSPTLGAPSNNDASPYQMYGASPTSEQCTEYLNPHYWTAHTQGQGGLTYAQQLELIGTLETEGMTDIETAIAQSEALYGPTTYPNFQN